ncbi:hypothetical protein [Haloprofundus halobius]|uniref:hypothetical protein n=1 Tax=Haloprofundus halobius TaxID=2876194 RepID=UPI001CCB8114|nr:hypothetical protein [Haloprofundus halobius]
MQVRRLFDPPEDASLKERAAVTWSWRLLTLLCIILVPVWRLDSTFAMKAHWLAVDLSLACLGAALMADVLRYYWPSSETRGESAQEVAG